jgi:hypothetical protein
LALEQPKERFEFFLAFGAEVMDRYGRLLGYINRHQPDPEIPAPRPLTYNERLLGAGMVSPYFIWPNVNPFRASESVISAAQKLAPGHARDVAEGEPTLRRTRQWVRNARQRKIGLYAEPDPLGVQRLRSGSWAGVSLLTGGSSISGGMTLGSSPTGSATWKIVCLSPQSSCLCSWRLGGSRSGNNGSGGPKVSAGCPGPDPCKGVCVACWTAYGPRRRSSGTACRAIGPASPAA